MKFETELTKASAGIGSGTAYRIITKYDVTELHGFYQSLNADQRRARFGRASDGSARPLESNPARLWRNCRLSRKLQLL